MTLQQEIANVERFIAEPRFEGIVRLYGARQVAEQRGSITVDYPVARETARAFYARLRELYAVRRSITTFGPYSPGQAVVIKRLGIEGIYLGGWATSAKGGITEDPGPDLASYPLSQVPDEGAVIVRALLTADRNQAYQRSRMTPGQRAATPEIDYRPFIIADADTGHGGDPHVRNLVRRFVEVGIPGYHIEDQKPGVKKCGHQGGKVVVSEFEQIARLNAARFQLDVMGVPGLIVARTDAEAASLLEGCSDERDQPFILGVTNRAVPSYRAIALAIMKRFNELGVPDLRGHLMFAISDAEYAAAYDWMERRGVLDLLQDKAKAFVSGAETNVELMHDEVIDRFLERWEKDAGLTTYRRAVANAIASDGGSASATKADEWLRWSTRAPWAVAREEAAKRGITVEWDPELAKTPDGYYQLESGLEYAIAKSLAAAPFADLLWMETATADLGEARVFAESIHEVFPEKMLAYNLSPSFNWDTTGMTDEEMRAFPDELAKLGFVFNFITYGGHQIDGVAAEEFATALKQDGMLALARLQRKIRLLESPYRTPQTLAGGPRLDAALMASYGRAATTKAMGEGSTQHQHLVQTEVSPRVLEQWLEVWADRRGHSGKLRVSLRPAIAGGDLLRLRVQDGTRESLATILFAEMEDRNGASILSIRDQHTDASRRRQRLSTLLHLFLLHRYRPDFVHYVSPTEDSRLHARNLADLGVYKSVSEGDEHVIVAQVNSVRVEELSSADRDAIGELVAR